MTRWRPHQLREGVTDVRAPPAWSSRPVLPPGPPACGGITLYSTLHDCEETGDVHEPSVWSHKTLMGSERKCEIKMPLQAWAGWDVPAVGSDFRLQCGPAACALRVGPAAGLLLSRGSCCHAELSRTSSQALGAPLLGPSVAFLMETRRAAETSHPPQDAVGVCCGPGTLRLTLGGVPRGLTAAPLRPGTAAPVTSGRPLQGASPVLSRRVPFSLGSLTTVCPGPTSGSDRIHRWP